MVALAGEIEEVARRGSPGDLEEYAGRLEHVAARTRSALEATIPAP